MWDFVPALIVAPVSALLFKAVLLQQHRLDESSTALKNGLVARIAQIADVNNNGVTSIDEWATVYKQVNQDFDCLCPQPLSCEEMELYLGESRRKVRLPVSVYSPR